MISSKKWIDEEVKNIFSIFKEELKNHLKLLRSERPETYGYAILLSEDLEFSTAVSVTNTNEFLVQNKDSEYIKDIKYIPDEWQDWHYNAFSNFNEKYKAFYTEFTLIHPSSGRLYYGETELYLFNCLYDSYLNAMFELKNEGFFGNIKYIVIWVSDSDRDIMRKSLLKLNDQNTINDAIEYFTD